MAAVPSWLDSVAIASPCSVPWDSMTGDDRKRHCASCRLDVYDVSKMTRSEAEEWLSKSEGRVCARLWRRTDGTLITRDCGRVRLALERNLRWIRVAAASILGVIGLGGCAKESRWAPQPTTGVMIAPSKPLPPPAISPPAVSPPAKSNAPG